MKTIKFKDLLNDIDGITKGPFGGDVKKSLFVPYSEDCYKVYEQGVVANNNYLYGNYYLSKEYVETKLKKFILKSGDVLITGAGTLGLISIVPENIHKGIINQALIRIRLNENIIDKTFFKYFFPYRLKKYACRLSSDSVIPNMPPIDVLKEMPVELPELDEQKKIASILNAIDTQCERNNDMVHKLQVLAQTIYSRWFNQFEFPNEGGLPYKSSGGKMVWNDELKREIPEVWQINLIGNLLIEEDKSKVQVCEAKTNNGVFPFFTSGEEILLYKDYFVDGPHCYLNTGGNADVKFFDGKASYSTDTWCISFGEYTYFINELLQFIKPQINKLYFSGSGLKHLQKESFKQLKLFIPDAKTLRKYNAIVSGCYQQIANIYIENNRLQSLKNSILPLLINGQLKV